LSRFVQYLNEPLFSERFRVNRLRSIAQVHKLCSDVVDLMLIRQLLMHFVFLNYSTALCERAVSKYNIGAKRAVDHNQTLVIAKCAI
jgi:hypothetical protein